MVKCYGRLDLLEVQRLDCSGPVAVVQLTQVPRPVDALAHQCRGVPGASGGVEAAVRYQPAAELLDLG
eukprot:scaffold126542_cov54-Phaeocystis_antarctica.AAC.2